MSTQSSSSGNSSNSAMKDEEIYNMFSGVDEVRDNKLRSTKIPSAELPATFLSYVIHID